jgi:hypothetical protein
MSSGCGKILGVLVTGFLCVYTRNIQVTFLPVQVLKMYEPMSWCNFIHCNGCVCVCVCVNHVFFSHSFCYFIIGGRGNNFLYLCLSSRICLVSMTILPKSQSQHRMTLTYQGNKGER